MSTPKITVTQRQLPIVSTHNAREEKYVVTVAMRPGQENEVQLITAICNPFVQYSFLCEDSHASCNFIESLASVLRFVCRPGETSEKCTATLYVTVTDSDEATFYPL